MSETLEVLVRAFERMAESHHQLVVHLEARLEAEQAARAALERRVQELDQVHHSLLGSSLALGRQAAALESEVGTLRAEAARLRDLDQRRVDLLATVAHELRTPLTSIGAALDILRSSEILPEAHPELLNIALINTQRLTRLMGTLLNIARLEAGEFGLERKPVDMGELVAQAVESLGSLAGEQKVEIRIARPPALPALSGDPERLKSVVINLLENALKHSRPGDTVVAEIVDRGADVLVAVTDEGPGIAPQDLAHIFDRFYRGSQQLPGSGLGLYISRVIVEEHGGRLWAESRERGSRFCFILPREGNPPPSPVPAG
ncbi:MAG TPA: ATP-binding protein [Candidatus Methylomirabilis sp.]